MSELVNNNSNKDSPEKNINSTNILLNALPFPVYLVNVDTYEIEMANEGVSGEKALGKKCYTVLHKTKTPCKTIEESCPIELIRVTKKPATLQHLHYSTEGEVRLFDVNALPIFDNEGNLTHISEYFLDVTEQELEKESLEHALEGSQERQMETSILLESSMFALGSRSFKEAARKIFDSCKKAIGSTSGYVALLSDDGKENEVLFLDAGGLPCTVDPSLPMPIRGLRAEAYSTGRAVFKNNFPDSNFVKLLPEGHVSLKNVLFAPLIIGGKSVGVIGLANKPGEITNSDARLATTFGELAAIALVNSYMIESLKTSEKRLRSVMEKTEEFVITINKKGEITSWNKKAFNLFEYTESEILSKELLMLLNEESHKNFEREFTFLKELKHRKSTKPLELIWLSKSGKEFPLEIILVESKIKDERLFLAVIRDVYEKKNTINELSKRTDEIISRISELSRFNEVSKIIEEQQKFQAIRDRFIAITSHELRTPLTVILGYLDILNKHPEFTIEKKNEIISKINRNSKRLTDLVDDVHNISDIRTRGISVNKSYITVSSFLKTLQEQIIQTHPNRQFIVNYSQYVDLPSLYFDQDRIIQVLNNLVCNALKNSPKETPIHLFLITKSTETVISVLDHGSGIPFMTMTSLFQPFSHFDTIYSTQGTGLGLFIAANIVEAHGGLIEVHSQVNFGSNFIVRLPIG